MFAFLIANTPILMAKEVFSNRTFEQAKKSIVTIHGQAALRAYEAGSNAWSGTGFLCNKAKGYILTNAHMANGTMIGDYHLFFHDGSRADAKLMYYDPWLDYAFLKVDPALIPANATEIKISMKPPVMDQAIFIIGNNEGKNFSIHMGTITGLYEVHGNIPQHAIRYSLNTVGGSSGSPIIDQKGEAVALNYASSRTFGLGVHADYLKHAMEAIGKGHIPARKHMGALMEIYSLNEAVRYRKFPTAELQAYNKQFPEALGNVLQVQKTLVGSPADGKLLVGDIIWKVNKQLMGPKLSQLDLIMNHAADDKVTLEVYRNGVLKEISLDLYHLESHKVKQMVSFGGTIFFKVDDSFSERTGVPANTLVCSIIQEGSNTFNKIVPCQGIDGGRLVILKMLAFDTTPILTIEQLIDAIPVFMQQKYFTISYMNYLPYRAIYGGLLKVDPHKCMVDVAYDMNTSDPKLFTFDDQEMEWKSRPILVEYPLEETLKWGVPCYMLQQKNIFLLHVFKEYCAILFFKGTLLKDDHGLLIQPGAHTQGARQMRFTQVAEVVTLTPILKAYIEEAIDIEKAGLKVILKKTVDFKVPEEFQMQLEQMPALKRAFDALTPGRQRAYLLHFAEPKQSKTRTARIEKCIQQILNGKGLKDE
eukprot:gene60-86_t